MLRRQWFLIEHINRGSCYCMRAKCLDEGWLINDRGAKEHFYDNAVSTKPLARRTLSRNQPATG
jgi:hypothetical protein